MLPRVIGDAFPEQAKNDQVAMLRMNTRPSQFNHLRAKRLERTARRVCKLLVLDLDEEHGRFGVVQLIPDLRR